MVLLCGLERAPTFLVPIINPPFADNSPPFFPREFNNAVIAEIGPQISKNSPSATRPFDQK